MFKRKTVAYKILLLIIMGVVLNACSVESEPTVSLKYKEFFYKPLVEIEEHEPVVLERSSFVITIYINGNN